MKKFGKFLYIVFIKDIGIKILALVLAAMSVAFINIPSELEEKDSAATTQYSETYEIGE